MTDSSSWKSTLNNEPLCFTGHQLFDAPETGASRATSHCLAIISQARSFKRMISMQMSGSKRTGGRANSRPINYVFISLPAKAASNPTPCLRGNARNRASLRKRLVFLFTRHLHTRFLVKPNPAGFNRVCNALRAISMECRNNNASNWSFFSLPNDQIEPSWIWV